MEIYAHLFIPCKKVHQKLSSYFGEIPVAYYNEISGKWEEVVNNRGRAYAARKRLMYRKRKTI